VVFALKGRGTMSPGLELFLLEIALTAGLKPRPFKAKTKEQKQTSSTRQIH
jgi:hypothetical protein